MRDQRLHMGILVLAIVAFGCVTEVVAGGSKDQGVAHRVADLEETVVSLQNQINVLHNQNTAQQGQIDSLASSHGVLQVQTTTMAVQLGASDIDLQSQIDTLRTRHIADTNDLDTQDALMDVRITTNRSGINALKSEIDSMDGELEGLRAEALSKTQVVRNDLSAHIDDFDTLAVRVTTHVVDTGNAHKHDMRYLRTYLGEPLYQDVGFVQEPGSGASMAVSTPGLSAEKKGKGHYVIDVSGSPSYYPLGTYPITVVQPTSKVYSQEVYWNGDRSKLTVKFFDRYGSFSNSEFMFHVLWLD